MHTLKMFYWRYQNQEIPSCNNGPTHLVSHDFNEIFSMSTIYHPIIKSHALIRDDKQKQQMSWPID